jgi:secreted PhoX family phosphatase
MQNNTGFEIDNSGIDPQTNFSANPEFADILAANIQRRSFLKGTLGTAVATVFGGSLLGCNSSSSPAPVALPAAVQPPPAPVLMGFNAIATNRLDAVTVPEGYTARAFLPMGTPLTGS